jgi:hypothetical protein
VSTASPRGTRRHLAIHGGFNSAVEIRNNTFVGNELAFSVHAGRYLYNNIVLDPANNLQHLLSAVCNVFSDDIPG